LLKLGVLLFFCPFVTVTAQTGAGNPGLPPPSPRINTIQTPPVSGSNPFQGSVPPADAPNGPLSLTLQDAIQRGLKYNLGLLLGDQSTRLARAEELRARAALLPALNGRIANTVEQVNLASFGFQISVPGFPIPSVVGPFNVFDARGFLSQSIFNLAAIRNRHAAAESTKAAQFSVQDARDVVVQLVAAGYLQVIADDARITESESEVKTAQALYQRALDMKNAGMVPAIDLLRAQVELQSEQTRLRGYRNQKDKDLLSLARLIGLRLETTLTLTDAIPYAPLAALQPQEALNRALANRSDYKGASSQVRAAELARNAAVSERMPNVALNADYGTIGQSPWSNHGTFTVSGSVSFPIFDAGRIRADIEQADATLQQRRSELDDLRQGIDQQVRVALLDLQTAADQVAVAQSSVDLARQALTQAQDRFAAGVGDNIEVVQAQTSVASASETYISSVFAHNLAKVALARALGIADQGVQQFLGGK